MMAPLHICEVAIRNAVSDALTTIHGDRWPWSEAFEGTLPRSQKGYNQRLDLQKSREQQSTTGKVIPELKFMFWQAMLTARHDERVWDHQLRIVFPNIDTGHDVSRLRERLHSDLDKIRTFRNRIAHHEPIFARDIERDLDIVRRLIASRCKSTAAWMMANQRVTQLLTTRPQIVLPEKPT